MSDKTGAKRKPFHRVIGLTDAEYKVVRMALLPPLKRGDVKAARMSKGRLKKLIMAALSRASSYGKALCWARIISSATLRLLDGQMRLKVMEWRNEFELKDLYLLRAGLVRHHADWRPNKARAMLKIDTRLVELAKTMYPGDPALAVRIERNQKRWASRRIPGLDAKCKAGPKKKRRVKKPEAKPPKEYVVDETLFTFESM